MLHIEALIVYNSYRESSDRGKEKDEEGEIRAYENAQNKIIEQTS